ncbi:MAG: T9SS type A sorting domain-containing protein [Bacteroidota bacterium]
MKKILLISAFFLALSPSLISQTTATNFTCDDCHGTNHDLFTELNSGKVIVIAWVMPCGGCISGALSGYSAAESFATSNPGQILFYLVDDYGNTSCSSLGSWGNTNGMPNAVPFSNALVNMGDYGTAGMPKVVVLGGANHTVFYNENNSAINQTNITSAINNALATSSVNEIKISNEELIVYPNPSTNVVSITVESLGIKTTKDLTIQLKNILGETVLEIFKGKVDANQKVIEFNTSNLSNGNYFISYTDGEVSRKTKVVVAH